MNPVVAFEALGHDTRLGVFGLLIPAGPDGLATGEISEGFLLDDCCANAPSGCLPGCPTTPIDAAVEVKGKPAPRGSKGQRR